MSCPTGKVRYPSAGAAQAALTTLRAEGKQGHTENRHYRCGICYGHHLTSKRPGRKRRSGRP